MRSTLTVAVVIATLAAAATAAVAAVGASTQTNHPPVVKIEAPANNTTIPVNNPISYQIHVSDQEDGDSRYDEINTKEVLLELALQGPTGKSAGSTSHAGTRAIDSALTIMATNNCFNCHQFNAKSLGPSFYDIAKRYSFTIAYTDTLTRRIKEGSSGIWGRVEKMPSHPELSAAAIRSTVRWVLQSAARSDRAWFFGTTGILHFPSNRPGTYTLKAVYTDHGVKEQPSPRLTRADQITIIAGTQQ